MNKIILHRHLFKNAGTSFDWTLRRNFGKTFINHMDDVPMRRKGADYLESYLISNPQVKAFSSHHLCNPLPIMEGIKFISVVFTRHPIERIWSVYQYEKKQNSNTPGSKKASTSGFKTYVQWRMRDDVNPTIRNFHTRQCSTLVNRPFKKIEPEHEKQAIMYLNNSMTGVVDRYDESMVLFEELFRRHNIELDLSYIRQNTMSVNAKKKMDFHEKLDFISNKLGSLYDEVLEKNALDFKLYAHANKILDRRFKKFIIEKEQQMESFKNRCIDLRKS